MAVSIQKKPKQHHLKPSMHVEVPDEVGMAVAHVTQKNKDGSSTTTAENVGAVFGKGPFANVGVSSGRTINLGDYSNVKVQVSLHVPSPNNEADINKTFEFAYGWVDGRMEEISAKIEGKKA